VSHPSKAKGDRAELEVQTLIRDLTGWPARRKSLSAIRKRKYQPSARSANANIGNGC